MVGEAASCGHGEHVLGGRASATMSNNCFMRTSVGSMVARVNRRTFIAAPLNYLIQTHVGTSCMLSTFVLIGRKLADMSRLRRRQRKNMLRMMTVMLVECPSKETIEDTMVGTDMPGNDSIRERVSIEASIGSWTGESVLTIV